MAPPARDGGLLEFHRAALIAALAVGCRAAQPAPPGIPSGDGRLTVEVWNASARPGLARQATRTLRAAGIDVVGVGTATAPQDSTRILVRRGAAAAGERVRQALGTGRVSLAPDSTRLLDVSVFLGPDFTPHLPFHP